MSTPSGGNTYARGQKRRSTRAKRRLTCSFTIDGQSYRGITLNLSGDGLFIQTDATVAPGSAIEIDLTGNGNAPDIKLRGVVARRRAVPAMLASAIQRGIGVHITEAPPEYGLVLEGAVFETKSPQHASAAARPLPVTSSKAAAPPRQILRLVPKPAPPARSKPVSEVAAAHTAHSQPELARPDVLVMDDGTLGDLDTLLQEIGAEGLRIRTTRGASPNAWVRPRRLLVTTAALALSFPWREHCAEHGFTAIAIADNDSLTLFAQIARLGFRHLVRRTIHPEALRVLLRQALHGGNEKRRSPRFAVDCSVTWGWAWRHTDATLVDLSANGCRLVSPFAPVELGSIVKINFAADPKNGRGLTLRGRIVRAERASPASHDAQLALAVVFAEHSARNQRALDELLSRGADGRVHSPRVRPAPAALDTPRSQPTAAETAPETTAATDPAQPAPGLSIIGIHAAAATSPLAGRQFALEIYEGALAEPLRIGAEVCAEDDAEGFAVRFVEPAPMES